MDHAPRVGVGHRPGTRCSKIDEEPYPVVVGHLVAPPSSAARVRPRTSFIAMNTRPSGRRPRSWTGHNPGVLELAADLRLLHEPAHHTRGRRGGPPGSPSRRGPGRARGRVPGRSRPCRPVSELADELISRRRPARDARGLSGECGPDQCGTSSDGLPEMDSAGRRRSYRPDQAGAERGIGAILRRSIETGRVPKAETPGRIGGEGGPQAQQTPGAEPRRRVRSAGGRRNRGRSRSAIIAPRPVPI